MGVRGWKRETIQHLEIEGAILGIEACITSDVYFFAVGFKLSLNFVIGFIVLAECPLVSQRYIVIAEIFSKMEKSFGRLFVLHTY